MTMDGGGAEEGGAPGTAGGWEAYIGINTEDAEAGLDRLHEKLILTAQAAEQLISDSRQLTGAGAPAAGGQSSVEQLRVINNALSTVGQQRRELQAAIREATNTGNQIDPNAIRAYVQAQETGLNTLIELYSRVSEAADDAASSVRGFDQAAAGQAAGGPAGGGVNWEQLRNLLTASDAAALRTARGYATTTQRNLPQETAERERMGVLIQLMSERLRVLEAEIARPSQ